MSGRRRGEPALTLIAGILLGVLTSLEARAQNPILSDCTPETFKEIDIQDVGAFCSNGQNLWMKATSRGINSMASNCCGGNQQVSTSLTNTAGAKGLQDGKWYPIDRNFVRPEVLELIKEKETKPIDLKNTERAEENKETKNVEDPSGTGDTGSAGHTDTSGLAGDNSLIMWVAITIIILILVLCFFAILAFFKKEGRRTGQRTPAVQADPKLLANALAEPLAEALRQALSQKVTVDLAPPSAARLSEWEPLLRKLGEVLGNSAASPSASGSSSKGVEGRRSEPLPAFGTAPSLPRGGLLGNSGEQRFVQRETTYGAGAKSFGGELAFQETNNHRAAFFIRLTGQGSGWLYPNPDAGEPDSLHQNLFGLSGVDDIKLKSPSAAPKPVRRDGQRWVLESQAR